MDEAKWLACQDAAAMLRWLDPRNAVIVKPSLGMIAPPAVSDRKLHLFSCACRRQDPGNRWVDGDGWKETEEDGQWHESDWPAMRYAMMYAGEESTMGVPRAVAASLLRDIVGNPFRPVVVNATPHGLAFPGGIVWDTRWASPTVKGLALAAYQDREQACERCVGHPDPEWEWRDKKKCLACGRTGLVVDGTLCPARLAVLSDALEEAGCAGQKCDRCTEPEALWRCTACGRIERPPSLPTQVLVSRLCPSLSCTGILMAFRPECRHCAGTGRLPHAVLAHLRSPGAKYRGAWSLDIVLGKE